jgi:dienelactone hydrolase
VRTAGRRPGVGQSVKRRTMFGAGAVGLAAVVAGAVHRYDGSPAPVLPDAPAGDERLEQRGSAARGKTVDFYTAVPDGSGDGRGLPVCLVLHGASATAADFAGFGFGRFLSDAVRRGAPPFVLAGATGGRLSWQPSGGDDPQRMVHEEIPAWCRARGFDTSRLAVWGWSMGGYGSLLLTETFPGFVRGAAAFSPAVTPGDAVFRQAAVLRGTPVGLWCGRDDGLYREVRDLEAALSEHPVAGGYASGGHNMGYWSTVIPAAFDFLSRTLDPA